MLLLIDSIGCTLLNAAVGAVDAGYGGQRLAASLKPGAITLFSLCAITLSVLVGGVAWHAFKGAGAEQDRIKKARTTECTTNIVEIGATLSPILSATPLTENPMHRSRLASGEVSQRRSYVASDPVAESNGTSGKVLSRTPTQAPVDIASVAFAPVSLDRRKSVVRGSRTSGAASKS